MGPQIADSGYGQSFRRQVITWGNDDVSSSEIGINNITSIYVCLARFIITRNNIDN